MTYVKDQVRAASDESDSAARIRLAALHLFRQRGYHGTSVRELAEASEMESASLYYHYPSKQAILAALFRQTMDSLICGVEQAIASRSGASARLRAAVLFHVHFHITHQDEAFVSHSELRALSDPHYHEVVDKRDKYEQLFRDLLDAGVREGVFQVADSAVAATGLLMMCSGVSDWFGPKGRLSADDVAQQYADMVSRMVLVPSGPCTTGVAA